MPPSDPRPARPAGPPTDRFADTFARHTPSPPRGLLPGARAWGATVVAATLAGVAVLGAAQLPELLRQPPGGGAGRPVAATANGGPSAAGGAATPAGSAPAAPGPAPTVT
ncbi:hypothetical protein ACFRKE_34100, partial [Kitasatospora indigofera]